MKTNPNSTSKKIIELKSPLNCPLILVMGKGGVGKTAVAAGIAQKLAHNGASVYLAHIDHSATENSPLNKLTPRITEQTLAPDPCFQEYIGLKLKIGALAKIFLKNKFIEYLQKASPGIREIVLLGKVWHELNHYNHVVVDMPGTGHGLAMLHAPFNFSKLFPGGPIYHDTIAMMKTLSDPVTTAALCVTLPEEMPLQESKELAEKLQSLTPLNKPWLIFNRLSSIDTSLTEAFQNHEQTLNTLAPHNPIASAALHLKNKSDTQNNFIKNFTALNLFQQSVIKISDYGPLAQGSIPKEAFSS